MANSAGIVLYVCIGETDWKIMAIDVTDPLADKLNGGLTRTHMHTHIHTHMRARAHTHTHARKHKTSDKARLDRLVGHSL